MVVKAQHLRWRIAERRFDKGVVDGITDSFSNMTLRVASAFAVVDAHALDVREFGRDAVEMVLVDELDLSPVVFKKKELATVGKFVLGREGVIDCRKGELAFRTFSAPGLPSGPK